MLGALTCLNSTVWELSTYHVLTSSIYFRVALLYKTKGHSQLGCRHGGEWRAMCSSFTGPSHKCRFVAIPWAEWCTLVQSVTDSQVNLMMLLWSGPSHPPLSSCSPICRPWCRWLQSGRHSWRGKCRIEVSGCPVDLGYLLLNAQSY